MKTIISKELSNNVKAIAILMVIIEHIAKMYFMSELTANYFGVGGVCCFLILSGYGLFVSYINNGLSFKKYWSNKLNKIFIPYSIITIIYSFTFIKVEYSILIKNLLCADYDRNIDGTMWYISFLLLWYILFFLVFYFQIPDIIKVIIMFGAGLYFMKYSINTFSACSWQFIQNAFSFPIGVLIGYLDYKLLQKIDYKKYFFVCKPLIILLSICFFVIGHLNIITISLNIKGLLIFITTIFCLSYLSYNNIIYKIIGFIGMYSFIIYLLEGKIIAILNQYNIQSNGIIFTLAFIVIITLLIFIYEKIKNLLNSISL